MNTVFSNLPSSSSYHYPCYQYQQHVNTPAEYPRETGPWKISQQATHSCNILLKSREEAETKNQNMYPVETKPNIISCSWVLMAPSVEGVRWHGVNIIDSGSQASGKADLFIEQWGEPYILSSQHPGCILIHCLCMVASCGLGMIRTSDSDCY